MADTRVQVEAEDWVRENWMPKHFGEPFFRNRIRLTSGGVFDFDAVNADRTIVGSISTSTARTSGGKNGTGKLMKLRSDMLFLLMTEAAIRRVVVLTDQSMYRACLREKEGGRTPLGIEFAHAIIPDELESRLVRARRVASQEVTPRTIEDVVPDEILLRDPQP